MSPEHLDNDSAASSAQVRGPSALIAKGLALVALASLTVFAVFLFVPEGNDYAEASILKHRRLSDTPGRRVVLVGGSNLAFGIDSTILERATACPVINMGMNGYLGVRYMLEEVQPHLRSSDIVVIALEYDSFYKSVEGTPTDQLMIIKANPSAYSYLDAKQRLAIIRAVPYVAQQKVLRILREAKDRALVRLLNRDPEDKIDINQIESLAGFTEHGDLISHLNVPWLTEREDGVDMTNTPRDGAIIELLQNFTRRMRSRGIDVLISHTSVIRDYYDRHERPIEDLYEALAHSPPLVVPSPPSAFVYDEHLFFDTVYHLNAEGRRLRSERLADDIKKHFNGATPCGMNGSVVNN